MGMFDGWNKIKNASDLVGSIANTGTFGLASGLGGGNWLKNMAGTGNGAVDKGLEGMGAATDRAIAAQREMFDLGRSDIQGYIKDMKGYIGDVQGNIKDVKGYIGDVKGYIGDIGRDTLAYRSEGEAAMRRANNLMAGGFNPNDPAFKFQQQMGEMGILSKAGAGGSPWSGQAAKDLSMFNQDLASTYWKNQVDSLLGVAGLGQNALASYVSGKTGLASSMANMVGTIGSMDASIGNMVNGIGNTAGSIMSGSTRSGESIANALTAQGNAAAAAGIAKANAQNNLISGLLSLGGALGGAALGRA
ncbi:MAG: hypothetical protein OEV94_12045 [Deltaproteobacteria bacterium]|nr:hypothetical protein [Deltaproteobacteria bacterium]